MCVRDITRPTPPGGETHGRVLRLDGGGAARLVANVSHGTSPPPSTPFIIHSTHRLHPSRHTPPQHASFAAVFTRRLYVRRGARMYLE